MSIVQISLDSTLWPLFNGDRFMLKTDLCPMYLYQEVRGEVQKCCLFFSTFSQPRTTIEQKCTTSPMCPNNMYSRNRLLRLNKPVSNKQIRVHTRIYTLYRLWCTLYVQELIHSCMPENILFFFAMVGGGGSVIFHAKHQGKIFLWTLYTGWPVKHGRVFLVPC